MSESDISSSVRFPDGELPSVLPYRARARSCFPVLNKNWPNTAVFPGVLLAGPHTPHPFTPISCIQPLLGPSNPNNPQDPARSVGPANCAVPRIGPWGRYCCGFVRSPNRLPTGGTKDAG